MKNRIRIDFDRLLGMLSKACIWILPADGGKTVGIQKLLEHYCLSPDSIMAFGDGDPEAWLVKLI